MKLKITFRKISFSDLTLFWFSQKSPINKLKVGENVYINELTDSKGKKYQGYINFNKSNGKLVFLFKNPNKQNESIKKYSGKIKGRKMCII